MGTFELLLIQKADENRLRLEKVFEHQKSSKHRVLHETNNLEDSLALLDDIYIGKLLLPHAIVLDGNLSASSYQCQDAEKILGKLASYENHKLQTTTVIGYSELYLNENLGGKKGVIPEWLDIGKHPGQLLRVIDQLSRAITFGDSHRI